MIHGTKSLGFTEKTMLNRLFPFIISLLLIAIPDGGANAQGSFSQKGSFELGGVAGMPSGLNTRYWFTDYLGIDSALGATISKDFAFTTDLLYEPFNLYGDSSMSLLFFFGGGFLLGTDEGDFRAALRLPVGLDLPLRNYPVNFSLYAAPVMIMTPHTAFDINFGLAARFNFGTYSTIRQSQASTSRELMAVRRGLGETRDKLDQAIEALGKAREELGSTKGDLDGTREMLKKTEGDLSSAKNRLDQTEDELGSVKTRLSDTKDALDTTRGQLVSMQKELDDTKVQLDVTKKDLDNAKKNLDDRESDMARKQAELDIMKTISRNAYSGENKKVHDEKLEKEQKNLDREMEEFKKEKEGWEEKKKNQQAKFIKFKERCEARRGFINEDGYCTCRAHETWNSDQSTCVCVKGYRLNTKTDRCDPCEIIGFDGACTAGCRNDEAMVPMKSGPHKFVCVKRCRSEHETWSKRKGTCVCEDGYYRDNTGKCVPRR
ncbi:MAG: hypothetical protein CVV44_17810 [Spirochaetae bacterium HGW-Spirochaetae-1]|nr:MAG: hypothetical protein CVV44_17810 [Spirochaetae bacterium HGW-Spirochaetae-1]